MLLNADLPEHQRLPREYDIDVNSSTMQNHYIFSEEDLPGFKAKNKARAEAIAAGITPAMLRNKEGGGGRPERPSYDRRSRYQPYYRKAIPSWCPPSSCNTPRRPVLGLTMCSPYREDEAGW
jgi:transcription initiation factor TFIIF subunit beta